MNIKLPHSPGRIRSKISVHNDSYGLVVEKANLLIPDISGFTRFVHTTDEVTGNMIIYRLLSAIMKSNILNLKVAEIEGDAILFFKKGKKFTPEEILKQYDLMQKNFNWEVSRLSEEIGEKIDLSLKLIAHYGPTADYKLSGFHKLYGKTVIAAHRLLKNSIKSNVYVLITDELLEDPELFLQNHPGFERGSKNCKIHGGLRNISFVYFDYEKGVIPSSLLDHPGKDMIKV
ncbi:DUF2652 domain-containing protein [Salinimicrobium flavum]|uniref:DUF2652 domain-containing protein n=1 Tax=Salinimicrobium flavum TaxID=1737065 RepID=A0ABW5J148_9FLAO